MTSILTRRTIVVPASIVASLASGVAMAHLSADGATHLHAGGLATSFMAGLTHPLSGLDHLAAMVSVGLWSALNLNHGQTRSWRALLAAPSAFAGTLLIGAVLGMAGWALPGIEPMIAASLLVLGLLVASRAKLPTAAGATLVAGFALFHGLAHGSELTGHATAALSGMVLSTAGLHAAGMALGLTLRDTTRAPKRWASRLAGAAVALFGLSLLTPAMAALV